MVFKVTRWALAASVLLTAIAMLLYPGGTSLRPASNGYSFFNNSLSDLGGTVAWNGQLNAGQPFHLVAGMIVVLAGSTCFLALLRVYSSRPGVQRLARAATMAALVAGVAMVGAVLAPEDRHPILHGRCSMVAMLSFPAGTALLAVATAGDSRLRRRVPLGWFALSLVILVWAAVAFTLRPATETELAIPVTLQKVAGVVLVATLVSQGYEAERIAAADPSSTTSPEVRNHADRARE